MTDSLTEVKQALVKQAGLDPVLLDRGWFERILRDRLRELGLRNSLEYCRVLNRDRGELQRLVEQVSVSETWFFRYPESFQLLARHLQSLRAENAPPRPLRMLSVACATGEEPYSMAIAAAHAGWPAQQLVLDAVDRNEQDIAIARLATYRRRALRDDAPDWAGRWFHGVDQRLRVAPPIVAAVHWIVADVLHAPLDTFQDHYDIIFCRNLLIYLHDSARQRLIERLANWLTERGLLFVGHAERTAAMQSRFEFTATPYAFALRRLPPEPTNAPTEDARALRGCQPRVAPSAGRSSLASNRPTAVPPRPPADLRSEQPAAGSRNAPISPAERQQTGPARPTGPVQLTGPIQLTGRVQPTGSPCKMDALSEAKRLADGGHLAEALGALEAIVADGEPCGEVYSLLGSVHLALGNLTQAREAFLKSVYLAPRCEDTLLQLALVYDRQGNQPLATRYRHRAAQVHRDIALEGS